MRAETTSMRSKRRWQRSQNRNHEKGTLADVIKGADVFIGVSAPGTLSKDMVRSMAKDPVIFACANPVPEIYPTRQKKPEPPWYPPDVLIFRIRSITSSASLASLRGALDVRATDINDEMKIAAAYAIAGLVSDEELNPDYILPAAFDSRVKDAVAEATKKAAIESGVARKTGGVKRQANGAAGMWKKNSANGIAGNRTGNDMIKVDLITGFLGAGKTTFIKKYARYLMEQGYTIGILENDYGAVNVDMMLLQELQGEKCDLSMVAGGCDADCHRRRFKTKLIAMGMSGYDRVLIEPSGIFDVDEFYDVLYEEPLCRWYEKGNVIAIVDGGLEEQLSPQSEFLLASQIAGAGTILISKTSQCEKEEIARTIRHMNRSL